MATFYRVVKTNPPTERDFLSMQALGRRLRADTPENRRIYDGVSVYSALEAIRVEQTTPDPDHYTLWASLDVLLATVVEVVPL